MSMLGKKYTFRLRSQDARELNTFSNITTKFLKNKVTSLIFEDRDIQLQELLRLHPSNKWNCRVVYFSMHVAKGLRVDIGGNNPPTKNDTVICSGIDIEIDEFRGCYYRSSNPDAHTILATANPDFFAPTDESNRASGSADTGENIEAVSFCIGASEAPVKTISITNRGTLTLRLRESGAELLSNARLKHTINEASRLCSFDEDGNIQTLPNFVIEFELSPYFEEQGV